jgi:hypothetical protein
VKYVLEEQMRKKNTLIDEKYLSSCFLHIYTFNVKSDSKENTILRSSIILKNKKPKLFQNIAC